MAATCRSVPSAELARLLVFVVAVVGVVVVDSLDGGEKPSTLFGIMAKRRQSSSGRGSLVLIVLC